MQKSQSETPIKPSNQSPAMTFLEQIPHGSTPKSQQAWRELLQEVQQEVQEEVDKEQANKE